MEIITTGLLPKISILVYLHNDQLRLADFLEQLTKLKYPHSEILIYDDNSQDNTWSICAQVKIYHVKRFRCLKGAIAGIGRISAWQFLAARAKGEILCCVDSETDLHDQLLLMKLVSQLIYADLTAVAVRDERCFLTKLTLNCLQTARLAGIKCLLIRKHALLQLQKVLTDNSDLKKILAKRGEKISFQV
jgi:hypothetical protein